MKADMRVPASGGTEYLLVIEAETDLERGALAHFVRATPVGYPETAPDAAQELRVVFATFAHRDPGNTGARSIAAAYIAWDKRAPAEKPAAALRCAMPECDGDALLGNGTYCNAHDLGASTNG